MTFMAWPDPLSDAPVAPEALAELNLARLAVEVSDSARGFVPYEGARYDGTMFGDAMRFLRLAEDLVQAVVIVERAHNNSWDDLADSAELSKSGVHKRWSPGATSWETALEEVEQDALDPTLQPAEWQRRALGTDPHVLAERLDAWTTRHAEPGDGPPRGDAPVSALLKRMNPFVEGAFLSRLRSHLLKNYMVPPPALEAALVERHALLDDAHAAHFDRQNNPRAAADSRLAASKNRAYAAELRKKAAEGNTGTTWDEMASPDTNNEDQA